VKPKRLRRIDRHDGASHPAESSPTTRAGRQVPWRFCELCRPLRRTVRASCRDGLRGGEALALSWSDFGLDEAGDRQTAPEQPASPVLRPYRDRRRVAAAPSTWVHPDFALPRTAPSSHDSGNAGARLRAGHALHGRLRPSARGTHDHPAGARIDVDESVSLCRRDHPEGEPLPSQAVDRRHVMVLQPLHQFTLLSRSRTGKGVPARASCTRGARPARPVDRAVPVVPAGHEVSNARHEAPRFVAEERAAVQGRAVHPVIQFADRVKGTVAPRPVSPGKANPLHPASVQRPQPPSVYAPARESDHETRGGPHPRGTGLGGCLSSADPPSPAARVRVAA
jgi:hypothetical protein